MDILKWIKNNPHYFFILMLVLSFLGIGAGWSIAYIEQHPMVIEKPKVEYVNVYRDECVRCSFNDIKEDTWSEKYINNQVLTYDGDWVNKDYGDYYELDPDFEKFINEYD